MSVRCPSCRVENRKPGLNCVNCGKPMSGRRPVTQAAGKKAGSDEDVAKTLRSQWIIAIAVVMVGFFLSASPKLGFTATIFGTLLNIVGWVLLISVSLRSKRHRNQVKGR